MWGLFVIIIYMNIKYFSSFDINFNNILFNLFGTKRAELQVHVNKRLSDASANPVRRDISDNPVRRDLLKDVIAETRVEPKVVPKVETRIDIQPSPLTEVIKKVDISSNPVKCEKGKEDGEVFHLARNKYSYNEAEEACKLFDARLATYDEVEDAYKNGANWCNYGWSSDQMALFPIQKSMYNELKKIPGHERDCGRTGINGGYIENKDTKFGVNCYGKKPYAGEDDIEHMNKYKVSLAFPDAELKKKERKQKMDRMLIAPFNKEKWNEF
jgi:hypothetical protein